MSVYQFIKRIGVFLIFVTSTEIFANELSLADAEQIALDSDFITMEFNARSKSLSERAIADGQWPDPKIKFGVMNIPVDSFDLDSGKHDETASGYPAIVSTRTYTSL